MNPTERAVNNQQITQVMKTVKGYKVFNPDLTCRGFQFKEGETFEYDGEIGLCQSGFHFHTNTADLFNYYSFSEDTKVAEVEAPGRVINGDDKSVTSKIKIIRVLTHNEVLSLVNTGKGNSGYSNSGDSNSGYRNSGDRNSGYRNSGDRNSGNRNSGNRNSGDSNSGNSNSGYRNSGDSNSGNSNSGHWNSGDRNSGDRNSGNSNSGDSNSGGSNSGDRNSGYSNSGYWNSGGWNSGDRNSGNSNSGDRNSGDWNSGHWNSGGRNSGCFNTDTPPTIRVFGKEIPRKEWDSAYKPEFLYFDLTQWVSSGEMTDKEKKDYPGHEVAGGYLKTLKYKEAFKRSWEGADPEDRIKIKDIPGFDADMFYKISGINLNK